MFGNYFCWNLMLLWAFNVRLCLISNAMNNFVQNSEYERKCPYYHINQYLEKFRLHKWACFRHVDQPLNCVIIQDLFPIVIANPTL